MDEHSRKQMIYEENSKSVGVGYLLWFFLGFLAIHRFYTGDTKSAIVRLALFFSILGTPAAVILWLIDLFRVPALVNRRNMKTIEMINGEPVHDRVEAPRKQEPPAPRPEGKLDSRRQAMLDDLRQTGYKKERRETNPLFR